MDERYERMEAYLESQRPGYYVPDLYDENTRVIVFYSYPAGEDVRAGRVASLGKTWHGVPLFDGVDLAEHAEIGVMHLSNVPLFAMDAETQELTTQMEYTRCCKYPTSEYLKREFLRKMTEIVENDRVRLVAYKLEMFLRYYEYFMENADAAVVSRLRARLAEGSLQVLPFPFYTKKQIERHAKEYNDFASALFAFEDGSEC